MARADPDTGALGDRLDLTADALDLDPLGWLRVAADPAELAARIARVARDRWTSTLQDAAAVGPVAVSDPEPAAGAAPPRLRDLLAAATAARTVLTGSRAASIADLTAAGVEPVDPDPATTAQDVAAAITRVQDAERAVSAVVTALDAAAAPDTTTAAVLDALFAASALGIAEATPELDVAVPDRATLGALAVAARTRLAARQGDAPALDDLDAARDRLAALCGMSVPLPVPVNVPADPLLRRDLSAGPNRLVDPTTLRSWLHDLATVRGPAAAVLSSYDLAEALDLPGALTLSATQLPTADPDPWAETDPAPRPGVTAVVAVGGQAPSPDRLTGLVLDTWVDTVPVDTGPTATHDGGLAFHYDVPDATPPQAVLVAVAPDTRPERQPSTWDLDTLLAVVTSTVQLATYRAVAAELTQDTISVADPATGGPS